MSQGILIGFRSVLSLVLVGVFTASCGAPLLEYDEKQNAVNEEAFKNRFNREAVAEEETGISIAPDSEKSLDALFTGNTTLNWKMVIMTGDDSIRAFDNARKKVGEIFTGMGVSKSIDLSRSSSEQVGGVRSSSVANFEQAAKDLDMQDGDACLLYMTSHGSTSGFYLRGQNALVPSKLDQIVDDACGSRPAVVLVSACYSGIFAEPNMVAPNRVILTAARKDKTSFGCSAEATYTYWDGCLIDNLPGTTSWLDLATKVEVCIERKESAGGFSRSYPQARFGADVQSLGILQ